MNALNPTMRIGDQLRQVIPGIKGVGSRSDRKGARTLAHMRIGERIGCFAAILLSFPAACASLTMAFSCRPDVLIADEPTTALLRSGPGAGPDAAEGAETGSSVLFITHDMAVVAQLCDRVYVMYAGQVVEQGTTEEVLYTPQHPYTQALLRSLPELAEPQQPLPTIQGLVPNLIDPPAGCRFRERCHFAHQRCHEMPEMLAADGTGRSALLASRSDQPRTRAALEQGRQAQGRTLCARRAPERRHAAGNTESGSLSGGG